MKNLLIITYYFPPERNVGSIRVKGLAKFLPYFGWNVFVLVPFFPQRESKEFNIIEAPLSVGENIGTFIKNRKLKKGEFSDKIPFNVLVTSFLRDIFPLPDNKVGWVPIATYIGKKIVRKYNISAIISSYSPATTHLVAYEIKKTFPNIFWIADFRDLWTQNPYLSYSSFTKNIYRKFEKKIISEANALTTVSSPMAEELRNFHSKPTFSIPNGFDPDEFNFPVDLKNKFTITYAGGLYSLKRNPRPLLIAISELIKEGKMKEKNIKVEFYGPYENALEKMIKELKLEKIVKYCGNIERKEVLEKLKSSQILLLLSWNDSSDKGTYTAKVFEYLGAKRPILSIGYKESVIKQLLDETNAGIHCYSVDKIKQILLKWYKEWEKNGFVSFEGREDKINNYTHKKMAEKFAEILENK